MSKLDAQFEQDRALRNAARANVLKGVELLKSGWSERGLAERVSSRIGGGAKDVLERASDTAEDNRGVLAALIGAIVLWFASGTLLDIFGDKDSEAEDLGERVNADATESATDDITQQDHRPAEMALGDDDE